MWRCLRAHLQSSATASPCGVHVQRRLAPVSDGRFQHSLQFSAQLLLQHLLNYPVEKYRYIALAQLLITLSGVSRRKQVVNFYRFTMARLRCVCLSVSVCLSVCLSLCLSLPPPPVLCLTTQCSYTSVPLSSSPHNAATPPCL